MSRRCGLLAGDVVGCCLGRESCASCCAASCDVAPGGAGGTRGWSCGTVRCGLCFGSVFRSVFGGGTFCGGFRFAALFLDCFFAKFAFGREWPAIDYFECLFVLVFSQWMSPEIARTARLRSDFECSIRGSGATSLRAWMATMSPVGRHLGFFTEVQK